MAEELTTEQRVLRNIETLARIEKEVGEVKITTKKLYDLIAGTINGKRTKGLLERVEDLEAKSQPKRWWRTLSPIQKIGVIGTIAALLGNNVFEVIAKFINIIHPIIDQLAK